ncbi:hypothetical protein WA026_004662 [Henosepilachna vigintioctopunctata]|uniref:Uncharacterized protein n=1 Tax=Henosepilachna vigintioctopunctata TaxID=420089 RepID=A0AAW1V2S8_9CUCU
MGKDKKRFSNWFSEKGKFMKNFWQNKRKSSSKSDKRFTFYTAESLTNEEIEFDKRYDEPNTSLNTMNDPKELFENSDAKTTADLESMPSTSGMTKIVGKLKKKITFSGLDEDDISVCSESTEESSVSHDFESVRDSMEAHHPSSEESNYEGVFSSASGIKKRSEDRKSHQPWRYSMPQEEMKFTYGSQMTENIYVAVGGAVESETNLNWITPPKPRRLFLSQINLSAMAGPTGTTSCIEERDHTNTLPISQTNIDNKIETPYIPQGKVHQLIKKFNGKENVSVPNYPPSSKLHFNEKPVLRRLEKKIELLMELLQTDSEQPFNKISEKHETKMEEAVAKENEKQRVKLNMQNLGIESLRSFIKKKPTNLPSNVLAELIEHIEKLNEIKEEKTKAYDAVKKQGHNA